MYKIKTITKKIGGAMRRVLLLIMALMIICTAVSLFSFPVRQVYAEGETTTADDRKLQNGSFEDGPSFTGNYSQPDQNNVPYWNTTAFQGKIELFKTNTSTYISGVTLTPTDGTYAAELNADEESTLYQNVKTTPSSVYEWGLDHGARNGTDTMALVIGPKQSVNPSKPSKEGRDHFMQMIDWLIEKGKTSVKTSAGLGEQLTVYSKKFAANGAFEDNAGNNAFSLTPSTIYTEEWHIWIMASSKATSGTNPWSKYGANAEGSAGSSSGTNGSGSIDLSKYYLYTVPAGQTETLFGFVSVGYDKPSISGDKAKTYGNFLDNINFQIYHPLSGSTTTHGSAVIGGSDGSSSGTGNDSGHKVTVDNKLTTYVKDGEPLTIQAIIKKADADEGCEFVGTYYTKQDESGNPVTEFLKLDGNEIEDTGSLTDEEKKGKWIKFTKDDGDIIYTYYLDNVTTATNLHFVFIKSPTVTYDPNGGKPYEVERTHNTDEPANVYSFKPVVGNEAQAETGTFFIGPYVSHAAEGQNDGWKFMGWKLTGDIVSGDMTGIDLVKADELESLILPAEHTIACDYLLKGVNGEGKAQYFKVYNGNVSLTKAINHNAENNEVEGVTWTDNSEEKAYANVHKGITMVAQWRWRQAVIPQVHNPDNNEYINSAQGGTVEITSVTDNTDVNYNAAYNASGGKSYHAATNEIVTIKATEAEGYNFIGWYDEKGNLITTNHEYSFSESKESVKTFYARFSDSVTQTYIRRVWDSATKQYVDTYNDAIATLDRYTYTDSKGNSISSTAKVGTDYTFVGWFDSLGNKVSETMSTGEESPTLSYITTGDATYYARFAKKITQNFIRQVGRGDNWTDTTNNDVGTLTLETHYDLPQKDVSSTAEPGKYYDFVGWFDSNGNPVEGIISEDGMTIGYQTTKNETYYARFSKKLVTQTFIRQIKNGDIWEDTTDDSIATLSLDEHKDQEVLQVVESIADAKAGYVFLGWYDAGGKKVTKDTTWSYTTTGDATYYARFDKAYSLSVSKIDGDKSTGENKVPIPGVEFTLYKADESGDETLTYKGESIKCYAVHSDTTVIREGSTEATAVFTDKLAAGTDYYLAETYVPTGYRLLEEPLKITIDSTGTSATIDGNSQVVSGGMIKIELANFLTLTMPVTGITFTGGWFAGAGLVIITSAVIGLVLLKFNRFKSINKK